MNFIYRHFWLIPFFCLLLSAAFFSSGIITETDNLKYLGIAFGMQQSGNYLVPMVNGVPYTDKPPLLFWLILAVWHIFGESLLGFLFLICLFVVIWIVLAKASYAVLFPEDKRGQVLLPYVLTGSFAIIEYCHYLHVDLILVTGVLLANLGILRSILGTKKTVGFLNGLMIFSGVVLGLLAKGPVIFVFTLLPYLLCLFFDVQYRLYWKKIVLMMIFGASVVFFGWVIPVILKADQDFLRQILYGQIFHRAINDSDAKSMYFYLIKLPFILLPWSLNIFFTRKLGHVVCNIAKNELFMMMIVIVSVIVLSCFGQKRFWYLLPCVPYTMMIIVRFIAFYWEHRYVRMFNQGLIVVSMISAILFMLISPYVYQREEKSFQIQSLQEIFSQKRDKGIAFLNTSSGDVFKFNYLAQLSVIPTLQNAAQVQGWLTQHPGGVIITSSKICPSPLNTLLVVFDGDYCLCV